MFHRRCRECRGGGTGQGAAGKVVVTQIISVCICVVLLFRHNQRTLLLLRRWYRDRVAAIVSGIALRGRGVLLGQSCHAIEVSECKGQLQGQFPAHATQRQLHLHVVGHVDGEHVLLVDEVVGVAKCGGGDVAFDLVRFVAPLQGVFQGDPVLCLACE